MLYNIIFRDPVFDGAADPTVIRRVSDGKLFMFYTQRRATFDCPADSVEWCYGTKIGAAVCDSFNNWRYVGALTGSPVQCSEAEGAVVNDSPVGCQSRDLTEPAGETEGLYEFQKDCDSSKTNNPSVILGFASDATSPYTGEVAGVLRTAEDSHPERSRILKMTDNATFWAPEVVFDGESYRMFVTYIDGVFSEWAGEASIEQYISPDLLQWRRVGRVEIESARVIDPCLFPLPQGGWRMWYKDEKRGSRTCFCDTEDFVSWRYGGFAADETAQEGPNVFALGGYYWLVADVWDGLAVYRSDDLTRFVRQRGNILPGIASHADVFCEGETARLVYFTYPEGGRRSAVCECGLTVKNGVLRVEGDIE